MTAPRPLNELLAGALAALTREIGHPALATQANLLRFIPDEGLDLRAAPTLSRASKRATQSEIVVARRWGWIACGGGSLRLTAEGRAVREAGARRVVAGEAAWVARHGVEALRAALEALVAQFDLELPHYPIGYGPADPSVTGGVAMRWGRSAGPNGFDAAAEAAAAEAWEAMSGGKLYVRAPGQDWKPVVRGGGDTVSTLPLYALLSQSLMAFAIDYEGSGGLALARSGNRLKAFPADGLAVKTRKAQLRGRPLAVPAEAGLAALERHAFASLAPDVDDPGVGRLTLTRKGLAVRNAYDAVVAAIEGRWRRRYGEAPILAARAALAALPSA